MSFFLSSVALTRIIPIYILKGFVQISFAGFIAALFASVYLNYNILSWKVISSKWVQNLHAPSFAVLFPFVFCYLNINIIHLFFFLLQNVIPKNIIFFCLKLCSNSSAIKTERSQNENCSSLNWDQIIIFIFICST